MHLLRAWLTNLPKCRAKKKTELPSRPIKTKIPHNRTTGNGSSLITPNPPEAHRCSSHLHICSLSCDVLHLPHALAPFVTQPSSMYKKKLSFHGTLERFLSHLGQGRRASWDGYNECPICTVSCGRIPGRFHPYLPYIWIALYNRWGGIFDHTRAYTYVDTSIRLSCWMISNLDT